MNTQKVLIGLAVVVVLGLGMTFPRGNTVVERITQLGAVASPDVNGPYLSVNGVASFYDRATMKQATSTLCSFRSPAATSSLFSFSADFTFLPTYATVYALGNDPTAFSTTTIITAPGSMSYAANVQATSFASSSNVIIPPSTFVNLKLSTTTAGASATFAPVGTCQVEFRAVR
jgi:hypothetical protein